MLPSNFEIINGIHRNKSTLLLLIMNCKFKALRVIMDLALTQAFQRQVQSSPNHIVFFSFD